MGGARIFPPGQGILFLGLPEDPAPANYVSMEICRLGADMARRAKGALTKLDATWKNRAPGTEDRMTTYEILSIIGLYAGLALIWYGLRQMSIASEKRNRELDEILANQAESREAFRVLIERTGG